MTTGPELRVREIPDEQRAALAWRLRNILAEAGAVGLSPRQQNRIIGQYGSLRGHVLTLILDLENENPTQINQPPEGVVPLFRRVNRGKK